MCACLARADRAMQETQNGPKEAVVAAAAEVIRRFGADKTRVVDIARAMGLSHSALYRHFASRSEIFAAVVQQMMDDEVYMGEQFVASTEPAALRLRGMLLELHRRKRTRYIDDVEVHGLYRFIVAEHALPLVLDYARRMTLLISTIVTEGIELHEFAPCDIARAAGAIRDAITPFAHPAMLEAMPVIRPTQKRV